MHVKNALQMIEEEQAAEDCGNKTRIKFEIYRVPFFLEPVSLRNVATRHVVNLLHNTTFITLSLKIITSLLINSLCY